MQQFNVPSNTSFPFGGGQRPDATGQKAVLDNPPIAKWFNTGASAIPRRFTFGTAGGVHPKLRGDTIETMDFSVFKIFRVNERTTVQFRAEWFNPANHPIFGNLNTTVGSSSFGIVTCQANAPR